MDKKDFLKGSAVIGRLSDWLFLPVVNKKCAFCGLLPSYDLKDGDYVCKKCWDDFIPDYSRIDP